eukprot:456072-Pleurochrysis_carterae.AAC.1
MADHAAYRMADRTADRMADPTAYRTAERQRVGLTDALATFCARFACRPAPHLSLIHISEPTRRTPI